MSTHDEVKEETAELLVFAASNNGRVTVEESYLRTVAALLRDEIPLVGDWEPDGYAQHENVTRFERGEASLAVYKCRPVPGGADVPVWIGERPAPAQDVGEPGLVSELRLMARDLDAYPDATIAARIREAANTLTRLTRTEPAEWRLTQQLACIQIIAQGTEPNVDLDSPAIRDVRKLREERDALRPGRAEALDVERPPVDWNDVATEPPTDRSDE